MNKSIKLFIFILGIGSAFADRANVGVKWKSVSSTVDNGDLHNLLRCLRFEVNGQRGVLLWKSSQPTVIMTDQDGNIETINGRKIVFKDFCEVNFIQEDFSVKCFNLKKVKYSENIRDYVDQNLGKDLPILDFSDI